MTPPPSEKRFVWAVWILVGVSCAVFVLAVARQVLPPDSFSTDHESLTDLRTRLTEERSRLRDDLQSELDRWQAENRKLETEIESLKKGNPQ